MKKINDILVDMVMDALCEQIASEWIDGQEFSVIELTVYVSNDDAKPDDIECIKEVLTDIANDYGLEINYSGDTAKFVEKKPLTAKTEYKEPPFFTC